MKTVGPTLELSLASSQLRRLMRLSLFATLGVGALFVASVFGSSEKSVWAVLLFEGGVIATVGLWRGFKRADQWTATGDLLAPAIALPLAYIAWFTLGSLNVIDLPASFASGAFIPIPASMWWYYALGLVGYWAGLFCVRSAPRPYNRRLQATDSWDPSLFWHVIGVLVAIMLVSYVILVMKVGVPWFQEQAEEQRMQVQGIPHFLFMSCAWTVIVLSPAYVWVRHSGRKASIVTLTLVIMTSLLLLSLGGRTNLAIPLVTLLVVFHYLRHRVLLKSALLFSVASVTCLSILGYARDSGLGGDVSAGWFGSLGVPAWVVPIGYSLLYIRYSVAALRDVVATIPRQVPYQYGALTFSPFKAFLPGHHESYDLFIKHMLGSSFNGAGQAATLLGPIYADFGAVGIFVGLFLFGLIIGKAYRAMKSQGSLISVVTYAWLVQTWFFGLLSSLFPFITTLTMPVLWLVLDQLMTRPASTLPIGQE